jgi:hypothetical protein
MNRHLLPPLVLSLGAGLVGLGLRGLRSWLTPELPQPIPRTASAPRSSMMPPPKPVDEESALSRGIQRLLRRHVQEGSVRAQFPGMVAELAATLEAAGLGDRRSRDLAARRLAQRLLEEAPPRPGGKAPLSSKEMAFIEELSDEFSAYARSLLPPGAHAPVSLAPAVLAAPAGYLPVRWDILGGFPFLEGAALPREVRALHGKQVALVGYMDALGETEKIEDFILMEAQSSCCFGAPPDLNQLVVVHVQRRGGIPYEEEPILVLGTLDVGERKVQGMVESVYRLRASKIERYREPPPRQGCSARDACR